MGGSSADNPFHVLGLAARYDLTDADINRAYLRAVARLHPDVGGADDAEAQAAGINQAKEVLLDPAKRAEALLRVQGADARDQALPPGFLMEMMELRETVEADVAARGDEARAHWRSWGGARSGEHRAKVAAGFAAGDVAAVRRELNAWRYVRRLLEQIDPMYHPGPPDAAP